MKLMLLLLMCATLTLAQNKSPSRIKSTLGSRSVGQHSSNLGGYSSISQRPFKPKNRNRGIGQYTESAGRYDPNKYGVVPGSRPRSEYKKSKIPKNRGSAEGKYISTADHRYDPNKYGPGKYVHIDVPDQGYKHSAEQYKPTKDKQGPNSRYKPNKDKQIAPIPYKPNNDRSPPYVPYIDKQQPDKQVPYQPNTDKQVPPVPYVPSSDKQVAAEPYVPNTDKLVPAVPYVPNIDKQVQPVPYVPSTDKQVPAVPYVPNTDKQVSAVPYVPNTDKQVPAVPYVPNPDKQVPPIPYKPETDKQVLSNQKEVLPVSNLPDPGKQIPPIPYQPYVDKQIQPLPDRSGGNKPALATTPTPAISAANADFDVMCPSLMNERTGRGIEFPKKDNKDYGIIMDVKQANNRGNYKYRYDTENKIVAVEIAKQVPIDDPEVKETKEAVGCYRYIGPDGNEYMVTYESGPQGFIPVGKHLPTPPPTPDYILRSLRSRGLLRK